jgi:DNA-binding transcriptional MerR regulator
MIRDLQDDGFNLGGIKRLLDDTHGTAERLLRFKRTLTSQTRSERAETFSLAELAERFRISSEEAAAVLAKAQKLGVLVTVGDGQFEAPSPSLLAAAEDVMRSGISLRDALTMLEEIDRHADAISHSFVQLFLTEVWEPFRRAGMPQDQWPEIEAAIGRLRPLAAQALMVVFEERMSAQVEDAFGEITRGISAGPEPTERTE